MKLRNDTRPPVVKIDRQWAVGALLIAATLVAYLPCLRGQFVWDDESWTTMLYEHLRDFRGLVSIWTNPLVLQQYFPLSGTTFWLDYQLWGFWTLPYHVENVLLHGTAAVLFWQLLRRLELPGALLAAAIFALHPMMVESAAWITERKNVLSMVLFLGAVLAYGKFANFWKDEALDAGTSPDGPPKNWNAWRLALLLTVAALLAKTTAFSLPPALLLLCWWKRGRLRWRADILPTLPFFAAAIAMGLVTHWIEKHHVGSSGPEWEIPFVHRFLIAGRALWFYVGKLLWPSQLCFVYPRWTPDTNALWQWLFPIAALGALLALWLARNRIGRGPLVAALFFGGSLFPFLSFMNGYFMRYSFVCDHWTYLSSLALIALVAALLARAAERLGSPAMLQGFAIAALPILAILTWRQCAMYSDVETLYRTTLAINPAANMARNNLGQVYLILNRVDEAIPLFQKASELAPKDPIFHNNLGFAFLQKGRLDDATAELRIAIELKPDYATAHFSLADALNRQGNVDDAIAEFKKAIDSRSDYAEAYVNLGTIALRRGHEDEAESHYRKAIEVQPANAMAHNNLGEMFMRKGRTGDAIVQFKQAAALRPDDPTFAASLASVYLETGDANAAIPLLENCVRLKPDFATAQYSLGLAYSRVGRLDEAIAQFERSLATSPDSADAHGALGIAYFRRARATDAVTHLQKAVDLQPTNVIHLNDLAWFYAACPDPSFRNGAKAVELAQEASRLSGGTNPSVDMTLAAAFAEAGRFPEAVATAQRALEQASAQSNTTLAQTLRQQIPLYQSGSALRPRPTNSPAAPKIP